MEKFSNAIYYGFQEYFHGIQTIYGKIFTVFGNITPTFFPKKWIKNYNPGLIYKTRVSVDYYYFYLN